MYSYSVKPTTEHQAIEPAHTSDPVTHYNRDRITQSPRWMELQPVQGKLHTNRPDDPYEQEADRVADQVMRMPNPAIQREPG